MSKSKQVNFFIVPEDWPSINQFLKDNNVDFIVEPFGSEKQMYKEDALLDGNPSQVYLTKEEFHSLIILKSLSRGLFIDILRSNCIQFSLGGFVENNQKLNRARFYAVTEYYNSEGDIVRKDKDFTDWVDSTFKAFNRLFLMKAKFSGYGVSEKAKAWIELHKAKIDTPGLSIIASEM